MKILLFKGKGIISALIRWQTRSAYSHAALLFDDGWIIEAWQGAGVRRKRLDDWTNVEAFDIPGITSVHVTDAWKFATEQIGSGYDYWSVLRFIDRRHMPENKKWFCSELVFEALRQAGIQLLARIDASEVSPGLLSLSTRLTAAAPQQ